MTCPGKNLKQAAAVELSICARGDARAHLGVKCQLSQVTSGSLISITCACGFTCILQFGAGEAAQLLSSISSTDPAKYAMNALRTASLRALSLPLPRSFAHDLPATAWEVMEDYQAIEAAVVRAMRGAALDQLRAMIGESNGKDHS